MTSRWTVLRQVVQAAQALTRADGVAILLYDRAQAPFVPTVPSVAVGLDERWLQRPGLAAAQSLALRAVEAGHIVEVLDTARTPERDYPLLAGGRLAAGGCPVVVLTSLLLEEEAARLARAGAAALLLMGSSIAELMSHIETVVAARAGHLRRA